VTESWTETVDSAAEIDPEFPDRSREVVGADPSGEAEGEGEAGIPDEPETFVEEVRAAADLPETGDPRVDQVLSGLAGIDDLPTADHVGVYDQVHRGLQDALANLDQG
jgi:hypothetical protein